MPRASPTSTSRANPESVHSDDADDEFSAHQSQSGSEAEVEDYVEMDVPLNDTDDDQSSNGVISESEASGPEEPLESRRPRSNARVARAPLTSGDGLPHTPTKRSTQFGSPAKTTPRADRRKGYIFASGRTSHIHDSVLDVQSSESESEPEEGPAPRRRYRPVLSSHKQWLQRDPQLEKQARAAAEWKAEMLQTYGKPKMLEA